MLFSSVMFVLIFLPAFLAVYYITPGKYRNITLFAGSLVFYAFGDLKYLPMLLVVLGVHYLVSRYMIKWKRVWERTALILVLVADFALLIGFKYFSDKIPLGISFYLFQISSYLIDVYKRKITPAESLLELGTYLCLFAQLIAGPIILYSDIIKEIRHRKYSMKNLEEGLKIFVIGLGSKLLIADIMGMLWNEIQVVGYASISTPMAWLGSLAYSMEIFFDFNGYSLMAIGLGRMMGFTIPVNFKQPYLSNSVGEFWRRWHVTLGTWFREYVYFPLGGSRAGKWKTVRNLLVVWIFTGMWHGKTLNFMIWAMAIYVLILIERAGGLKFLSAHRICARIYMCVYILLSWTIFAIDDLKQLAGYFQKLFPVYGTDWLGPRGFADVTDALTRYGIIIVIAVFICTGLPSRWYQKVKDKLWMNLALLVLFVASVYWMFQNAQNPFLYFRF